MLTATIFYSNGTENKSVQGKVHGAKSGGKQTQAPRGPVPVGS